MSVISTHLIIFASATLQREAWRTLLKDQPSIIIDGALAEVARAATDV